MDEHSNTPPPPAAPLAYAPPVMMAKPKKSRWWLWLLIGGGGVVGLVILCAGGFAWFLMSGKAKIEPVVDAFQAKIDAGDFQGAYQSIGPEWKAINTEEVFTSFESAVHRQLGKLLSKSMTSINIQDTTVQGTATMAYNCSYEKGQAVVTYTLTKSTGAWLVVGHRVECPAMIQMMTCPKCGTVSENWVDFCGKCGAKLDR